MTELIQGAAFALVFFFHFFLFLFLNWSPHNSPDAVSTLLICPDRFELYGVQQLSGAVASLEEKQKR